MTTNPPEPTAHTTRHSIYKSFSYAAEGLLFLFKTQRNARIELALGAVASALSVWLQISRVEWVIILFTIALVLILEGLNTSIECAVDLASPNLHPTAKAAKDLAAAMVLIAAIAAFAVGLIVLGPPLLAKVFH